MKYHVIYDGNCNLCSNLVQVLETLDQGKLFDYIPMQDHQALAAFQITPTDCEMGMILIKANAPEQRWQGSEAAEEIANLLPGGSALISLYRSLPGMKPTGDRIYEQVRDRRYDWFGKRESTYQSAYPIGCNHRPQN